MANVRKRILQLTPLPSASLDTTIVGVDNGVTYRIELDVLADAVTSRVNILDRDRLNSLESVTSSFEIKGRNVISSSTQITTLGFISTSVDLTPLNTFTQSIDGRVDSLESATSSYLTSLNGTISSSAQITSLGFISQSADITLLNTFTASQDILNTAFINGISARLQTSSFNEYTASQSTSSLVDRLNSIENVSGSWITESETGSFLTTLNGAISSSSQLTSSFDTRYTLSGSVQNIELPSNLVSGSSQLTSSYDTRYALSSSYNTDSASFNSRFNGLITTGSNTFSGSQIFSGSMTVTSGQVIASTITNNSSSLYLQSGSNLYVQNNGIVEITGSLKVNGTTRFETVGGDEGGEIEFGVPQTNTTLSTRVVTDIWQNRLRIFDGNTNGVFIDLSKAPTGVGGELMHKASGFVNAGDYVTLGNLKARIPTSGNRSLQVATISGTYSVVGSDVYSAGGAAGTSITSPLSITTTPTYLNAGLHFVAVGYTDTWIIMDYVAFIAWRITMVIGPSFNANLITIERLY